MPEPPADASVTSHTILLARGNERAWRWLHESYYDFLFALAMNRGSSESDAADLVQRTYLRVLRHAKRFRREADLRRWLCCLLRCEIIDAARKRKRRSLLLEKFQHRQELNHVPECSVDVSLQDLLSDLQPTERALLTQHYVDGWSQHDLARARGVSTKAIESRLARLRKRLRQSLKRPHTEISPPCSP